MDADHSGAIAKPELKRALQEMGMYPSNADVARLLKVYDSSGEGLLDITDFRELMFAALDIGKQRAPPAEASATHEPVLSMFSKSGRLHPGTKRVRYYVYV